MWCEFWFIKIDKYNLIILFMLEKKQISLNCDT